jgi:hypothetical protein
VFVFKYVTRNISQVEVTARDMVFHFFFLAVGMANGIALGFPMSQALRSTAHVEQ